MNSPKLHRAYEIPPIRYFFTLYDSRFPLELQEGNELGGRFVRLYGLWGALPPQNANKRLPHSLRGTAPVPAEPLAAAAHFYCWSISSTSSWTASPHRRSKS